MGGELISMGGELIIMSCLTQSHVSRSTVHCQFIIFTLHSHPMALDPYPCLSIPQPPQASLSHLHDMSVVSEHLHRMGWTVEKLDPQTGLGPTPAHVADNSKVLVKVWLTALRPMLIPANIHS